MSKYPSVTGKRLIKELLRVGYIFLRQKGSHVSIGHPKDKRIFAVVMDTPDDLIYRKYIKISTKIFNTMLPHLKS